MPPGWHLLVTHSTMVSTWCRAFVKNTLSPIICQGMQIWKCARSAILRCFFQCCHQNVCDRNDLILCQTLVFSLQKVFCPQWLRWGIDWVHLRVRTSRVGWGTNINIPGLVSALDLCCLSDLTMNWFQKHISNIFASSCHVKKTPSNCNG